MLREGSEFKFNGPSSRRISKRSFLGSRPWMILSRSLRLMNFKEPEEEEECLEGNLKFGCIFDYKGRVLVSNQNLKTVVPNTQDV